MVKVTVIGSGNVALHLVNAFAESNTTEIVQLYSRKKQYLKNLPESVCINSLDELAEADIYIIAVSDDAIAEVAGNIPFNNRFVVHTSGSVALNALPEKNRRGVFYPLQTFSKNKEVGFKTVPLCLETEFASDHPILNSVAKAISDKVFTINSEQRKALHVSAVFVNNFTNHLYSVGNEICREHNVPFDILKPLISETAEKIQSLSPQEAQTGPAKRNDKKTIHSHLDFLSDENHKKIYELLTQSIRSENEKL